MHCCKNRLSLNNTALQFCAALALLLFSFSVLAEGVFIRSASTQYDGERYRLSAKIDYHFSSDVRDALHNGVPIGLRTEIEISRKRSYWADEVVATLVQNSELSYKPLSRIYLVTNLNSGAVRDFSTEQEAIEFAGRLENIPLIDHRLMQPDEIYIGRIRARISQSHLPFVIRIWSLMRPGWRFESEGYQWLIRE